mgnify:FL=1
MKQNSRFEKSSPQQTIFSRFVRLFTNRGMLPFDARNAGSTLAFLCMVALSVTLGCGPSAKSNDTNDPDAHVVTCDDADGDGICDEDEGRQFDVDTDGDGTPDYRDTDSDNDGIDDSVELGTTPGTTPVDSDGDSIPDFRDDDSDGNGIPDVEEGAGDADGDGLGDFADQDDDNDSIADFIEIGQDPNNPTDTDGDGIPDYRDEDSDNDLISDRHDSGVDSDGDGVPNFQDTDSDDDGIPDSTEAGDSDLITMPVDTDGDGINDFIDPDSDNDGLADILEHQGADGIPGTADDTDPLNEDTDNDGVSDLVEWAAETDPNDPADNPRENGDFVFLEPYEEPPDPTEDRLAFSTNFQALDMYILLDNSGSMDVEMSTIKDNLATMLSSVICSAGEDPATDYCIPDVQTGYGRFGVSSETWSHRKDINDNNLISDPGPNDQSTEYVLPGSGSGGNEQHIQALSGATTGTCASDPNRLSRACFRPGALGLVILVSDEDFSEDSWYGNSGQTQPVWDNMADQGFRVVGVTGDGNEVSDLRSDMMSMSGGNPVVNLVPSITSIPPTTQCSAWGGTFFNNRAIVDGPNTNAANAMTCAIQAITAYMPQNVYTSITNDPTNVDWEGNPVDAVVAFVDHIEVFQDGSAECSDGNTVSDTNGDGYPDRFEAILPGTPVCWKLYVKQNDTVEPSPEEPMMFTATVEVHGEGGALLDEREVYFLVPPVIEGPILE